MAVFRQGRPGRRPPSGGLFSSQPQGGSGLRRSRIRGRTWGCPLCSQSCVVLRAVSSGRSSSPARERRRPTRSTRSGRRRRWPGPGASTATWRRSPSPATSPSSWATSTRRSARRAMSMSCPPSPSSGPATGTFEDWPVEVDGPVFAVAVDGDTVYLAGDFRHVGGALRVSLAAVSLSSGAVLPWDPQANVSVEALAVAGGNVYIGGAFTAVSDDIGSVNAEHLARISAGGVVDRSWSTALSLERPGPHHRADGDGSGVYVGGDFGAIGSAGYASRLTLLSTGAVPTIDPTFRSGPNNQGNRAPVFSLALQGNDLLVAAGGSGGGCALQNATTGATQWAYHTTGNVAGRGIPRPDVLLRRSLQRVGLLRHPQPVQDRRDGDVHRPDHVVGAEGQQRAGRLGPREHRHGAADRRRLHEGRNGPAAAPGHVRRPGLRRGAARSREPRARGPGTARSCCPGTPRTSTGARRSASMPSTAPAGAGPPACSPRRRRLSYLDTTVVNGAPGDPATAYTYTVLAINSAGEGPASAPATALPLAGQLTTPSAPQAFTAVGELGHAEPVLGPCRSVTAAAASPATRSTGG